MSKTYATTSLSQYSQFRYDGHPAQRSRSGQRQPDLSGDIPSFYGFHIHESGNCSNNFANTGGHYNPKHQPHPYHAGDLPPITSCDGYSWMCIYIEQLALSDVLGRSVVVHAKADDFTSQPSGNSGEKIACGVIEEWHG